MIDLFVQARMGSTRLPGKVLMPIMGKPLLAYQIERLSAVRQKRRIVVLTTSLVEDNPIVTLCQELCVDCFRGAPLDVLDRFFCAAQETPVSYFLRSTADCPLIDPDWIDRGISLFFSLQPTPDYLSNTLERTFPRGLDFEIFQRTALEVAWKEAKDPWEREHVTPYIYRHQELFRLQNMSHTPSLADHRWTVDTPEDLDLVTRILETLYPTNPHFRLQDILDLLKKHPDWSALNAHVKQKNSQ